MRRLISSAALAVLAMLAAVCLLAAGCGGTPSAADELSSRLLTAADLPAGWSATAVNPASAQTSPLCLSGLASWSTSSPGVISASAAFAAGPAIPVLGEALFAGPQAAQRWQTVNQAMADCISATVVIDGQREAVQVQKLAFPRVGTSSQAYQWSFTVNGTQIDVAFVAFTTKAYPGYIAYSGRGTPSTPTVLAFADAAAAKAASGQSSPVPASVSVIS